MQGPPPAAAAAWLDTMDGLSRGLNHALSNRVNTFSTLMAVLHDARTLDAELENALVAEEARMEALLRLYRLMPLARTASPEPMVLADPVNDALALFAHHLDLRMLPCTVTGLADAPPVRSRRQSLTQGILLLLVAVGRAFDEGHDESAELTLQVIHTADDVTLHASTGSPVTAAPDAVAWGALEWMASTLGAVVECGRDDNGHAWAALALPTLAAERKRGR